MIEKHDTHKHDTHKQPPKHPDILDADAATPMPPPPPAAEPPPVPQPTAPTLSDKERLKELVKRCREWGRNVSPHGWGMTLETILVDYDEKS